MARKREKQEQHDKALKRRAETIAANAEANKPRATRRRAAGKPERPSAVSAGRDPQTGVTIPHQRNEIAAARVKELAGLGLSDEEIAVAIDVRPGQLRMHYLRELKAGAAEATILVATTAFRDATTGGDKLQRATQFWLQCRAKWVPTQGVSGPGGKPLGGITPEKLASLPDDKLAALMAIFQELGVDSDEAGA